jgi:hypothetical protein
MYNRAVTAKLALAAALALVVSFSSPRSARAEMAAQPTFQDFTPQARQLYRVTTCGGDAALPANVPAALHEKHCKELSAAIDEYKKKWLSVAMPFIARLLPAGLPTSVVYPYAGGDLVTALAVYPDATELTTISLESAGDPRGIDTLAGEALEKSLSVNRHNVVRLMRAAFSATTELAAGESSDLPGQLILALAGLVVHGYEPVSLRYFTINPDGTLHYVTTDEIAAYDKSKKKLGKKAERELRVSLFSNAELGFRKAGQPAAPVKIYRHIAANLYDGPFAKDGPLMKFLVSRGPVAAMTKAASHLLWSKKSSHMRDYLLGHMVWMLSDATGVPSADAEKAGFVQVTFGKYAGAYFEHRAPGVEAAFVKLWKEQPYQELPFRFGYFDKAFQSHMLITKKK